MDISFSDFRMNMKHYRAKKNMSQAQLAEECDCSNGMIGAIEAGRAKPSFDMILAIAKSLQIHPADLFLRDTSVTRNELKKQLQEKLIDDIKTILNENFCD
ncbi:MAG: helix-turn-helix transcriptional regulator [Treponema sp.]|nr:helix-turn-helix transcriptional regulator [Treponema sp.]